MRQVTFICILMILMNSVYATEDSQTHSIKCNMTHLFDELPDKVDSIDKMFSQGMFYGRLRFNSFGFRWAEEIETDVGVKLRENHAIASIGGSLIYKSAYLNGFGVGAGFYTTTAAGTLDDSEAYLYKAGKGVISRYDFRTDGTMSINTLAQAYLEYTNKDVTVKAGRQIFESFLTKSNDTKMIPNTFEGLTVHSTFLPNTLFKMAYLTRQKLRDHSDFHHVLAAGDDDNDSNAIYSENDDSAMHFGLKLSKLEARNIDDRLIVVEAKNYSMEDVTLSMNYTAVPDLISSAMLQADYRFDLGSFIVIPGLRYMKQFDDGAGEIGGANLKTVTHGYSDPVSLDAELYAARINFVEDGFKLRFGYTKVADKGDIVAPWRGFPTAGFTRSMAQYNWYANTESYMVQVDYEFETFDEFKIISRYAIQDFDDNKVGVQADSKVFEINFFKGLGESPVYLKTRFAHVVGDSNTIVYDVNVDGELEDVTKRDPSYNELRIELNYLF